MYYNTSDEEVARKRKSFKMKDPNQTKRLMSLLEENPTMSSISRKDEAERLKKIQ
jgi:hypothetical protein